MDLRDTIASSGPVNWSDAATPQSPLREAAISASMYQRSSPTRDSFQNFQAALGVGTNNVSSASTYGFNPITRVRTLLEWMYRGSWIVGKAVDAVAEDMVKAGVSWLGEMTPDDQDKMDNGIRRTLLWPRMLAGRKWARLYGGALVVMMIDGQRLDTPLRVESVKKGQLRGFQVLDRWMINPTFTDLVDDPMDPQHGFPRFYDVVAYAPPGLVGKRIHHSRCTRMIGVELPYWQMVWENYWGMSVLERLYDRLIAFDSATQGASQLMYKAYLRTLKIKDLRKIVSAGGPAYQGLLKQIETMRLLQTNEGLSVTDLEDELEAQAYSFAGVGDTILQFGQQLAGAIDTPLVRLFGQSPAGLNSTGESDMRIYYDGIQQRQETDDRQPLTTAFRVMAQSEGVRWRDSYGFGFNPLWQLTEQQKSEIGQRNTETILSVEATGKVSDQVVLRELRQQSRLTGIWTNITDEDIDAASDEPEPMPQPGEPGAEGDAPEPRGEDPVDQDDRRASRADARDGVHRLTGDAAPLREVAGLPIVIETERGTRRLGPGWSVIMPCDYGYFRGTTGADGEQVDCFVGPEAASAECGWVVDALDPRTGQFDEHKVMIGFGDVNEAMAHFRAAYDDQGSRRVGGVRRLPIDGLRAWLLEGDHSVPLSELRAVR